jgi:hypothetical protein
MEPGVAQYVTGNSKPIPVSESTSNLCFPCSTGPHVLAGLQHLLHEDATTARERPLRGHVLPLNSFVGPDELSRSERADQCHMRFWKGRSQGGDVWLRLSITTK